jgi:CubicO group peptidase (beta-lactamase class C family)
MSTSVLLHRLRAVTLVTLAVVVSAQTPASVEERIEHIQNGLLRGVVINGEPAPARTLASEMAAMHVPGVSIAVIHRGKIEWARGFGVASIGGALVTPDTLFEAASISKPVAAIAVLRLVESGKINLDADVNQYLRSWKVPGNDFPEQVKVTMRELLTHTAGFNVHGPSGYAPGVPVPTLLQVLNGGKPANNDAIRVDKKPGTLWRYSSGGYVVVQQLLQDLTGESFPKLMHDTVLVPIGMTHSTFEQPLPNSRMAEIAVPHRADGKPAKEWPLTRPEMAAIGLWTTPSDLARYALAVQGSLAGAPNAVLSKSTVQQMLTPGMNDWGLGPELGGAPSHRYFTHSGGDDGYRCYLLAYNEGDGVVIMTNGNGGDMLAPEIVGIVAREYGWPDFQPKPHTVSKVDPKIFDLYTGEYQSQFGVITVTHDGDQLFAELSGGQMVRLYPETDRSYFLRVAEATVTFDVDLQGKATQLAVHQNGNDVTAKRVATK